MRQHQDDAELSREINTLIEEISRGDGCMDIERSLRKLIRFHRNDPERQRELTVTLMNEASAQGWPIQLSGRRPHQEDCADATQ